MLSQTQSTIGIGHFFGVWSLPIYIGYRCYPSKRAHCVGFGTEQFGVHERLDQGQL